MSAIRSTKVKAKNYYVNGRQTGNWNDVTDFEVIPVISSQEMSEKMAKGN